MTPRCGPTHHLGCDCWEARRDAELAALRAALAVTRTALREIARGGCLELSSGEDHCGDCNYCTAWDALLATAATARDDT